MLEQLMLQKLLAHHAVVDSLGNFVFESIQYLQRNTAGKRRSHHKDKGR